MFIIRLFILSALVYCSLNVNAQVDSALNTNRIVQAIIDTIDVIDTTRVSDTLFIKRNVPTNVYRLHASAGVCFPTFAYRAIDSDKELATSLFNEFSVPQTSYKIMLGASCKRQQWMLYVGLGINILNQKLNYSGYKYSMRKESFKMDTTDTYISGGTTYYITDTVWKMHKDSIPYKKTINNRYLMLEMPILLGYSFKSGSSAITLATGPVVYYMLKATGETLSLTNTNMAVPIASYTSKFGFGWQFKASIDYRINKYWSIDLSPYYTAYLTSLYKRQNGIQLSASMLGFSVGVKRRL